MRSEIQTSVQLIQPPCIHILIPSLSLVIWKLDCRYCTFLHVYQTSFHSFFWKLNVGAIYHMHNNSRLYAHLTAFSSYGRSLISTLGTRTPSIMVNDQGWPIGGWPPDSISIHVCTFSFVRRDPDRTLYASGTATPLASASVLLVGHILIQPYNCAHRQQDSTLCLFRGTTYWLIQRHHTSLGVSAQLGLSEDSTNDRVSRRAVLLLTCKPFRSVSSTPLTYFPL